jgi:hypothetical protein
MKLPVLPERKDPHAFGCQNVGPSQHHKSMNAMEPIVQACLLSQVGQSIDLATYLHPGLPALVKCILRR